MNIFPILEIWQTLFPLQIKQLCLIYRLSNQSFCLYPTTADEIEDVIDNLNSTKATGPYSIPTGALKSLKVTISKF